eukprot:TRINITY_DN2082_c0_g1_i1.p1 TRINITY_DN2082_c0_g1~~TRINITY_DN2082_c0_g1_i1.p1  ORF type:complete len:268 (+),score=74.18 TRINITY_DN2082_c0_g1_i1:296-1099(+)
MKRFCKFNFKNIKTNSFFPKFKKSSFTDLKFQRFYVQPANIASVEAELNRQNKLRLTWNEFTDICQKNGFEASEASKTLEKNGKIIHLVQGKTDFVYIDTKTITEAVDRVLDPSGNTQAIILSEKKSKLGEIVTEFNKLDKEYHIIEAEAEKSSKRIIWTLFAYMSAQAIVVTRLTFWELNWDIMEPITYMGSFTYGFIGIIWYGLTRLNPEYVNVFQYFKDRSKKKLIRRNKFDEQRYADVKNVLISNKRDLEMWGEKELLSHLNK